MKAKKAKERQSKRKRKSTHTTVGGQEKLQRTLTILFFIIKYTPCELSPEKECGMTLPNSKL